MDLAALPGTPMLKSTIVEIMNNNVLAGADNVHSVFSINFGADDLRARFRMRDQ